MDNGHHFDRIAGIVLIGTHSWANSPFDRLMPRVLLPLAHRPLLSYAVWWLHDSGINRAVVCGNRDTRMLGPLLERHVPSEMEVAYREDSMPRGAAGCVRD